MMTQTKIAKKTTTESRPKAKPRAKSTPSLELQSNPFQFEILELASKQRSNAKKEEVLVKHRNDALVSLLIWNFDDSVVSLIPHGDVPFEDFNEMVANGGSLREKITSNAAGDTGSVKFNGINEKYNLEKTSIRKSINQLSYFIAGKRSGAAYNLRPAKRENMFITLLQGLHPSEAEILCLVKDKDLTSKYKITFENVKNAYPDIIWGTR
jgi:hypothetical protein